MIGLVSTTCFWSCGWDAVAAGGGAHGITAESGSSRFGQQAADSPKRFPPQRLWCLAVGCGAALRSGHWALRCTRWADVSAVGFGAVKGGEDVEGHGHDHSELEVISLSDRHNSTVYSICRHQGVLVLEKPYDTPSVVAQYTVGIDVARTIRFELGGPPLTVSSRRRAVLWARMPKAAVYEDRNPLGREHNVDAATIPYDPAVDKEPKAESMQR